MYKPVSMSSVRRLIGSDWIVFHEVVVSANGEEPSIYYFECPMMAAEFYLGLFNGV